MKQLPLILLFLLSTNIFAQDSLKKQKSPLEFSHRWSVSYTLFGEANTSYHLGFTKGIHQVYFGIGPSYQNLYYPGDNFLGFSSNFSYFLGPKRSKFALNFSYSSLYLMKSKLASIDYPNAITRNFTSLNLGYAFRAYNGFDFGIYYGIGLMNDAGYLLFYPVNLKASFGINFDNLKNKKTKR